MFPWPWRFLPFLSARTASHGTQHTLLSTERESRQLWAFRSKHSSQRPASRDSPSQQDRHKLWTVNLRPAGCLLGVSGVGASISSLQPPSSNRLALRPSCVAGPLFDAQLSRPATSSSFLSCRVNPPPFLLHIHHGETHCKLSHVHNESPAPSGSTSHLGPASVPSTRCSRLSDEPINSGTLARQPCQCAVTRASASQCVPFALHPNNLHHRIRLFKCLVLF